jgi:beta-aspartyl-peptidase (threonine type)
MNTDKHGFAVILVLVMIIGAATPGYGQRATKDGQVAAIRAMLHAQVAAWNRGDLEGFMAGYWQSDRLTFFSGGSKTTGWQAMLDRYRKSYQSEGREMGQLEFVDLDIHLLGRRGAFARGGWELRTSKGQQGGPFTLVLRKTKQGWKVIHDHTSAR